MTIERAKARVSNAMRVIVDYMVGENSEPKESYQAKYDAVRAVDDEVIDTLSKAKCHGDVDVEVRELHTLATHIKNWSSRHSSFFLGYLKPERWMFR